MVLVARTTATLLAVRDEIDPEGRSTVVVPGDIGRPDAAERIADAGIRAFGEAPSVVVHSAGVFLPGRPAEVGDGELELLFHRNVVRTVSVVRRLIGMRPRRTGHVVMVNSTAGLQLHPVNAVYSATMMALRSMTDALRNDLNPYGVRVTSIFTGRTDTPMLRSVLAHEGRGFDPRLALRPDDVAAAVAAALDVGELAEITDITLRPMRPVSG